MRIRLNKKLPIATIHMKGSAHNDENLSTGFLSKVISTKLTFSELKVRVLLTFIDASKESLSFFKILPLSLFPNISTKYISTGLSVSILSGTSPETRISSYLLTFFDGTAVSLIFSIEGALSRFVPGTL